MCRNERRRAARHRGGMAAAVVAAPEQPMPAAEVVDLSPIGVLVRLPGPAAAMHSADRVLLSIEFDDGPAHTIGRVRRLVKGADDHFYLAVEFCHVHPDDVQRLEGVTGRRDDTSRPD